MTPHGVFIASWVLSIGGYLRLEKNVNMFYIAQNPLFPMSFEVF